jgi:hypothetical protein
MQNQDEQFAVFKSAVTADKRVLLERQTDHEALDVYSKLNSTGPSFSVRYERGMTEREDYHFSRTR